MTRLRIAVVGASGYAGAELVSLLAVHPAAKLEALVADASAGRRFEDLHPGRRHLHTGMLAAFDADRLAGLDVVFLTQPHGAAALAARALLGRVGRIIDLSGDLRLPDAAAYRKWYGADHPAPELLGRAVYALPELFPDAIPGATLLSCPGCYATAAQLAAAPALRLAAAAGAGALAVTISAASGTTGAGRKAELDLGFSEVDGGLRAYRVGRHQHTPEIAQGLARHTGRGVAVTFVPHLAPFKRGIFATVVVANPAQLGQDEVLAAYREAYRGQPFVRVLDPAEALPRTSDVEHTNFCDLAPVVDAEGGTIVVLAVLDNLGKGAAAQAVQVMNLACGLPETAGLLPVGTSAQEDLCHV
jgi:N-acetyl-gamma-glutamyl-phosphate reductase